MNLDTITCADIFDLCATVPDGAVDMILCDLPYGTTACSWDTVIPFEPMWKAFKRIIKPRGAIVLTASQPFTSALVMSNPGWFKYAWVWDKANGASGLQSVSRPIKVHEDVLMFSREFPHYYPLMNKASKRIDKPRYIPNGGAFDGGKLRAYNNNGVQFPKTILRISNADQSDKVHPTQKPVALFEYLIRTYTQPGELVFDPCCGSGTTAIAARRTERHFVCGDSSPEYVAIANERLQNTDPFQDRKVSQNVVQHSLFQGMAE